MQCLVFCLLVVFLFGYCSSGCHKSPGKTTYPKIFSGSEESKSLFKADNSKSYLTYASLIDKTIFSVFYVAHKTLMIDF